MDDVLVGRKKPLHSLSKSGILHEDIFLTPEGRHVLGGKVDAIDINGLDKWIGGCHLESTKANVYRWSESRRAFIDPHGVVEAM